MIITSQGHILGGIGSVHKLVLSPALIGISGRVWKCGLVRLSWC